MENDLQFERADFTAPTALSCSSCRTPLTTEYYAANDQVLCEACASNAGKFLRGSGLGAGRFLQALTYGVGAAVAGAAVYAAIMIYGNMQLSLVSIAIGWLVGKAVRTGSRGRGGWRYQLLAALLTYAAICTAYGATLWSEFETRSPETAVFLILNAYRLPFLGGFENVLGILIIAFGVWQAWQMNTPLKVEITGPHAIGSGPHAAPSAPTAGA